MFFIGWRLLDRDACLALELNANHAWEGFAFELFGFGMIICARQKIVENN